MKFQTRYEFIFLTETNFYSCTWNNRYILGTHGGAMVEALRYEPEGRGIEFFIDIILPAAL
jgi:hypothetical protein